MQANWITKTSGKYLNEVLIRLELYHPISLALYLKMTQPNYKNTGL